MNTLLPGEPSFFIVVNENKGDTAYTEHATKIVLPDKKRLDAACKLAELMGYVQCGALSAAGVLSKTPSSIDIIINADCRTRANRLREDGCKVISEEDIKDATLNMRRLLMQLTKTVAKADQEGT